MDRARLSRLRTGAAASDDLVDNVEAGQTPGGGWPAQWAGEVASVDATCFRLAELDDLGGLRRPAATRALEWLAQRQRQDGFWEEDATLAKSAPPWAQPGDRDARFYLTANAAFWLAIAAADAAITDSLALDAPNEFATTVQPTSVKAVYGPQLDRAARAILDSLAPDGSWPGFLVSGWLAAAVLNRTEYYYEAARILVALAERVPSMSAADTAWMVAALRRAGIGAEDSIIVAGRQRLSDTQRPDGAWPSDDAPTLDVHTTLTALRALR